MIYPTLFIGLGSTGLNILKQFQELVLEHYGRASLDIFKYIAIESREAAEIERSEWGENEIKLLRPVIKSTDAIKSSIDSGHKQYLKDWLNIELLNIEGSQFVDGASNIRMAGRLILWENWDSIKTVIYDSYSEITSDENKKKTDVFLQSHYSKYGQDFDSKTSLVGSLPNVYIVGTLCGGTCSGMFIDIGYYIKHITGLWAKNLPNPNISKVFGIFSIFDSTMLNNVQQEGLRLHAANCWAALKEYDFFCHPQTRYKVTFPDGTTIDTNERPIDWLYIISCSATDCKNQLRSNFRRNKNPDIESLNHMTAMILFTEVIGGLLEKKEAIRTDYRARSRATMANENEHLPCITTCGVATVWYPKYRIALGAACKYGAFICKEWLGELKPEDKEIIDKNTISKWNKMLYESQLELISSIKGTIIGEVEEEFDENKDKYINISASEFKSRLQEKIVLLNKGNKYDTHINDPIRISNFKKKLITNIYNYIKEIINTKSNLAYAEYSLKKLDEAIASTIERLPMEYPKSVLSIEKGISSDIYGKLVFKAKEIETENKKRLLNNIKKYIVNQIKKIRNFRMRSVLEEIREEIGVGKDISEDKKKAGMVTIKEYLDNIKESLNNCINDLEERYKNLSGDLPYTQDVSIVSQGSIKDDINQLVAQLKNITSQEKERILNLIKGKQTLSEFIGFEVKETKAEEIKEKMIRELIRESLKRIESFDVIDNVLKNCKASEICEFAKHGLPHLELTPGHSGLASVQIGRPVSFVAGGRKKGLDILLDDKLKGTDCEGIFGRNEKSPLFLPELSHMLIFYREEPLMYMDDNLATATLFENYYKKEDEVSKYGVHIHKSGGTIFDPCVYARRNKTEKELMPIAINVLTHRDKDGKCISSEIFEIENGRLVLRGKRKNGSKFYLTPENGVELCAQDKEIFNVFKDLIEDKLKKMKKTDFIKKLNNYLDWIERKAEKEGKDPGLIMEEERKKIMEISLIKERFS